MLTTGGRALADALKKNGTEYVFGIPGLTEVFIMEGLDETPEIEYVLGFNEIVCVGMAEGYARITGKPGVLNLHSGPGFISCLGLLNNAKNGGVPLVITTGQQDSRLLLHDPHLTGDITGIAKRYAKWACELTHPEDIAPVIRRAFKMSQQYPTGATVVSCPQDVMQVEFDYEAMEPAQVFTRVRPDTRAVEAALKALQKAQNPLIMVEGGVSRCDAQAELVAFAELIGAPVYASWASDVDFPMEHALYMGDADPVVPTPPIKAIFEKVDLVIAVGYPLYSQGVYFNGSAVPKNVKYIQFDENPWEIDKTVPLAAGVLGDIKLALQEVNAELASGPQYAALRADGAARREKYAQVKAAKQAELEKKLAAEQEAAPLMPGRVFSAIKNIMPQDAIIVDECWSSSGLLRSVIQPSKPYTYFRSRRGGSIGWGLPAATGVQLGAKTKKVIAVVGDGSAAWSLQTLWSAARYRLPVTYVVLANQIYGQVRLSRKLMLPQVGLNDPSPWMDINNPAIDFAKAAESMGVQAARVSKPAELEAALATFMDVQGPTLVHVDMAGLK